MGAALDAAAHRGAEARHAALHEGEHPLGLLGLREGVGRRAVLGRARGRPTAEARADEEEGGKPLRREARVLEAGEIEGHVALVEGLAVVDEHLHGHGRGGEGALLHRAIDHEAREGIDHGEYFLLPSRGEEAFGVAYFRELLHRRGKDEDVGLE